MHESLSTSFIARGLLALVIGGLALAWPGVTVLALVVVFAVFALVSASMQALQASSSRRAGSVVGHLLLGLVDIMAGLIALAWPVPTALVLVLVVACWAVATGVLGRSRPLSGVPGRRAPAPCFSSAAWCRQPSGRAAPSARPGMGAISLDLVFGLFNLISGGWLLAHGIDAPSDRRPAAGHGVAHQREDRRLSSRPWEDESVAADASRVFAEGPLYRRPIPVTLSQ